MTARHLNPGEGGYVAHALQCDACRAKLAEWNARPTITAGRCATCGRPCKRGTECRRCAIDRARYGR